MKEILKSLRNNRGISMQTLCNSIDMPLRTYQNYENGSRTPTIDVVIKLAKYYNVTTDYLLGINEDEPKELVDLIGEQYHLDSVSRGLVAMYIELEPKERKKFIEELKKVVCKDCDKSKP